EEKDSSGKEAKEEEKDSNGKEAKEEKAESGDGIEGKTDSEDEKNGDKAAPTEADDSGAKQDKGDEEHAEGSAPEGVKSQDKGNESAEGVDSREHEDRRSQEGGENNGFEGNSGGDPEGDSLDDNMHTSIMEKLYKLDYKLKFLRKMLRDDKKMLIQLHALGYLTESIKQQIVRDVAALNDTVRMEAENANELNKLQSMHDSHVDNKLDFIKHENILAVNG
ncbi:retinitis pigmentosa GTPase regulator, partial [Cryptosporidium ryanae]|uniref:retinitis pigmentosa GTPase regulator n=1 Tax=Cryptosporidium ryanae TaxID=515981 RepID=UPI003519D96C